VKSREHPARDFVGENGGLNVMQFDKDLQLEKARKKLADTAQKFLKAQHTYHTTMAKA
jgi:hypothetical protein